MNKEFPRCKNKLTSRKIISYTSSNLNHIMGDISSISVNNAATDINKINLNGTEYNLGNNSSRIFEILSDPSSSEFYISTKSGDSANLAGRSFTRTSNLPVVMTNCKNSNGYHGWFLFGRTAESVESTKSITYQSYITYTLDSGSVIHIRYLSAGMLNSNPTFYVNGSRHSLYISCW